MIKIFDLIEKQLVAYSKYCNDSSKQEYVQEYFQSKEAAAKIIKSIENW